MIEKIEEGYTSLSERRPDLDLDQALLRRM